MFMSVARQLIETGKVAPGVPGRDPGREVRAGDGRRARPARPDGRPRDGRHAGLAGRGRQAAGRRRDPGNQRHQVEDDAHLINLVSLIAIGKTVPLLIFRDGKTLTSSVRVGDRSKFSQ